MATPTANPQLPQIPESLVRRLYKAARLRRRAEVLAEGLREEILKLTPISLIRAKVTSIPFGELVLTYTKRRRVNVDWDLVLQTLAPGLISKVEEAKLLAQVGKKAPEWIKRSDDIAVTAGLEKKKKGVA